MKHKVLTILGWFYILIGLTCNSWVWEHLTQHSSSHRHIIIWLFDIGLIILGIFTLKKDKAKLMADINFLIWATLIIAPILGEIIFRAGIALNIKHFKTPSFYADYFSDDDYWKLKHDWAKEFEPASAQGVQPLLGWSQSPVTKENPLGLHEDTILQVKGDLPKILFYGDSFVQGESDKEYFIPIDMTRKLEDLDVVDLSVGGHGIDQIYLMFDSTYQAIKNSKIILVGILGNDDLDRAVLSVRTSQKPYFIIDEKGDLKLQGVPISTDQEKFFRNFRLSFKSYLFTFLKHRFSPPDGKRELKMAIAAKLIDRFQAQAKEADVELVFVLFYGYWDLMDTRWQEKFLKEKLAEIGARYIDTKEILLGYAKLNSVDASEFYDMSDGHHHNLGNQVVSDGIIAYLKSNAYIK